MSAKGWWHKMLSQTRDLGSRYTIGIAFKGLDPSIDKGEFFGRDGEALSRKWLAWWEDNKNDIIWDSEEEKFVMKGIEEQKSP